MTLTPMTRENIERIMVARIPDHNEIWTCSTGSVRIAYIGSGWVRGVYSETVVAYRWIGRDPGRRDGQKTYMMLGRFIERFKAPEAGK